MIVHLLTAATASKGGSTACGLPLTHKALRQGREAGTVTSWASQVTCPACQTRTPKTDEGAAQVGVRARARSNMDRLGIPAGTDDPLLLALGASPLPDDDG
jgi:hypothetical protein